MHRASINKRINRLEQKHEQPPLPCLFLLRDFDGTIGHNGVKYADLAAALDALRPHDYVIADVVDGRRPSKGDNTNA